VPITPRDPRHIDCYFLLSRKNHPTRPSGYFWATRQPTLTRYLARAADVIAQK
jgi:hypothetical protein